MISGEEPIEEENIGEENNDTSVDTDTDTDTVSDSYTDSNISHDDIVEALKEIVNENVENNTEGDNLSGDTVAEEDSVSADTIDYTEYLISIDTELANIRELLQTEQAAEARTIFDKPLNEFTVSEGIGALGVVAVICVVVIAFIKHFTFDLWK